MVLNMSPSYVYVKLNDIKCTLPETNSSPLKRWFPIGISFSRGLFSSAMLVSGRVPPNLLPINRPKRFNRQPSRPKSRLGWNFQG